MTRSKKIVFRSALVVVGLIAIGAGFLFGRSWWFGRQVDAKIAALHAAGQPVSLHDLAPASVPADRNAATYLLKSRADVGALAVEIEANYRQANATDEWELFTPSLQETMTKSFAAYPEALALLDQVAACDGIDLGNNPDRSAQEFLASMYDHVALLKNAARTLRARALLAATDDRPDEGLRHCGTVLRLASFLDREPTPMTDRLVSLSLREIAIRAANAILQSKPTSPAARETLRKDAELGDLAGRLRKAILGERAFGLAALGELPRGYTAIQGYAETNVYLDVMGQFWDVTGRSDPNKSLATGKALAQSAGSLTQLIVPALEAWQQAEARTLAKTRCLLVLLAALDESAFAEKLSPTIEDLTLPDSLSIDPFNGGKLTLRKGPRGLLIYSVGPDLKDDGGRVDDFDDAGEEIEPVDVGLAPLKAPAAE